VTPIAPAAEARRSLPEFWANLERYTVPPPAPSLVGRGGGGGSAFPGVRCACSTTADRHAACRGDSIDSSAVLLDAHVDVARPRVWSWTQSARAAFRMPAWADVYLEFGTQSRPRWAPAFGLGGVVRRPAPLVDGGFRYTGGVFW